jgi:hypothetical protein
MGNTQGKETAMRKFNRGDDPEAGLVAALKAMAIVLAVAVLAVLAGQAGYPF